MLQVRSMTKSYNGHVALHDVDLDIRAGEVVALLGENGAGKSTLVSIITGLRRPDSGTVTVAGVDVLAHPDRARRSLGLAPQDLGIYRRLTTRQNLVHAGRLSGVPTRVAAARVDEVAPMFGLEPLLARKAYTLSGGEARRLHTAMALVHRPSLVLLDEPTAGVDIASRQAMLTAVRQLADEGVAVCYSTHYMEEVETLRASLAVLDRGRLIARGSMGELVDQHGGSAIELTFSCAPPVLAWSGVMECQGTTLRLFTNRPAGELGAVVGALGPAANDLTSVELVRPSVESVFLALTGRRFDSNEPADGSTTKGGGTGDDDVLAN
jgi:ABC-2 type transport system ATP-binding protein